MVADLAIRRIGYVSTLHAGAAISALGYNSGALNTTTTDQFYFSSEGELEWELTVSNGTNSTITVPLPLTLWYNMASNVAPAAFTPSTPNVYLSCYPDNGTLYYSSGSVDDRDFNETRPSYESTFGNLTNFHLCYQYVGGYYYRSISWVQTLPPQNPSCEPVDLSLVQV
jgi:hypothetical protein